MDFRFSIQWFRLNQLTGKLWFLPAAFSLLAVVTIALAIYWGDFVPEDLAFGIDRDGLQAILTILGSSMLTVAVFALSTLVGAVSRASDSTTPRAVPLIVEDRTAQTSISIFVGAFLFAVVGIIGLSAGIYSEGGRLILFGVSVLVVLAVVVALVRWIGRISTMGRTTETVRQVEEATRKTLAAYTNSPHLGCRQRTGRPTGTAGIAALHSGFIQHIDVERLEQLAEQHDTLLDIVAMPGDWVARGDPLLLAGTAFEEADAKTAAKSFTIANDRSFALDPRHGLRVLAEIAMKALSPGINDTGTAIEAISAQTRALLAEPGVLERAATDEPSSPHVSVQPLTAEMLITDAFRGIGRDAGDKLEVVLFVIECLAALSRLPPYAQAGRDMITEVAARATARLDFEPDRRAVEAAAGAAMA